jgi:hypothetical protein
MFADLQDLVLAVLSAFIPIHGIGIPSSRDFVSRPAQRSGGVQRQLLLCEVA